MNKFHVILVSFNYSSLTEIADIRRRMQYSCKKDRLGMVSQLYTYNGLKTEYEKGFGYEGNNVKGFYESICSEAYLTKSEIRKIVDEWDTNLLVYNMHNGHEY